MNVFDLELTYILPPETSHDDVLEGMKDTDFVIGLGNKTQVGFALGVWAINLDEALRIARDKIERRCPTISFHSYWLCD